MDKVVVIILLLLFSYSLTSNADTYRSSDGASCSYNRDHSDLEVKLYVEGKNDEHSATYSSSGKSNSIGVELVYKIGAPAKMDCNRLYEMDLLHREAELKKLKKQLELMSKVSDLKW